MKLLNDRQRRRKRFRYKRFLNSNTRLKPSARFARKYCMRDKDDGKEGIIED